MLMNKVWNTHDANTPEDAFCRNGDVPARAVGLCGGHRNILDARVSVDRVAEDSPESQETSQRSIYTEVLHKRTGVSPVLKAIGVVIWAASTDDDKGHDVYRIDLSAGRYGNRWVSTYSVR